MSKVGTKLEVGVEVGPFVVGGVGLFVIESDGLFVIESDGLLEVCDGPHSSHDEHFIQSHLVSQGAGSV